MTDGIKIFDKITVYMSCKTRYCRITYKTGRLILQKKKIINVQSQSHAFYGSTEVETSFSIKKRICMHEHHINNNLFNTYQRTRVSDKHYHTDGDILICVMLHVGKLNQW